MRVAPILNRTTEARRVSMARILDRLPAAILIDPASRTQAYVAAAIGAVTPADDADAVRRSLIFRALVARPTLEVAA